MNYKILFISAAIMVFANHAFSQATGSFNDSRDGKVYKTVKIGAQTWMAENLNYASATGSYCYQDNKTVCDAYGRLYDWEAARISCPKGWHLPSDAEWKTLEITLGMSQASADSTTKRGTNQGDQLKHAGTSLWGKGNPGNTGNNSSGFTALPAGARTASSEFKGIGAATIYWTSTEDGGVNAWGRVLGFNSTRISRGNNAKKSAFSVRCLMD